LGEGLGVRAGVASGCQDHHTHPADQRLALAVRELRVRDDRGVETVRGLTFEVDQGEIFGVAGVDGNGQAELAEAVVGLRRFDAGSVQVLSVGADDSGDAPPDRPGYIPQDRRRAGLVLPMSVRDNLVLELSGGPEYRWGPFLRREKLWSKAREMGRRFNIRVRDDRLPAAALSGGNQQKIVVARALTGRRSLLVAVNPTRGLDVRSTGFVHEQLRSARADGVGILLISTELEEVLALSDRLGVLFEGRFQGILPPTVPRTAIGQLMGGASASQALP
jgi:general nucleoside transport system ATP-binding protein